MKTVLQFFLMLILGSTGGISALSVAATTSTQISGSTSTTGYSGKEAAAKRTLAPSAMSNEALTGVEIAERSDDPCFLRARFRNIATGNEGANARFAECDDNNNNEGTGDSHRTLMMPSGGFVTGVRICMNSQQDKMKGIQLIGRYGACLLGEENVYVSPAPCSRVFKTSGIEYRLCDTDQPNYQTLSCSGSASTLSVHYERTNCQGNSNGPDNDWEEAVNCPDRMVATGMRLNHREGNGGRRIITGVALDCRKVELPD